MNRKIFNVAWYGSWIALYFAVVLLVGGCEDDHIHNIFVPSDTLPVIVVCDTACRAVTDTVYCYREKVDGNYTFVCEAEKRDD